MKESDAAASSGEESVPLRQISTKNQQLKVITNVVEYVLEPGDHHDSAWKVEGMRATRKLC
jgi:hypothetical protein